MDVFEWIEREFELKQVQTDQLFYDEVESHSERCLSIICQPFDVNTGGYWNDRGSMFDCLH